MKRFYAVFISLIIVLTCCTSSYFAVTPSLKNQLESEAIEYIESYIQNVYLYKSNDLSHNTLKEKINVSARLSADEYSQSIKSTAYTLNGHSISAATLCEGISSFEAASDYLKYIRSTQKIERYDFSASVSVIDTDISDSNAVLYLYSLVTFRYTPDADLSSCGDYYKVSFVKDENIWSIAEVLAEEHVQYGLTNFVEKYNDKITEFDNHIKFEDHANLPQVSYFSGTSSTYDRGYSTSNAIAYAYTYTTCNHTGSYNNPDFLNKYFFDCTYSGGNCQNFASQCVWAGFGGIDTYNAVNNRQFPMNTDWYGSSDAGNSSSWIATDSFYSYVNNSSSKIISTRGTINGNFSGIPLYMLKGAVLHVNPNSSGYAHAVVITNATGTNFGSIEICGNSPMRKAVLLSDQAYSSQMRLIMPTAMKNGRDCTNGTHSFSGNHSKCNYCGFNKLTITGSMLKPVPVNSTQSITATTNSTCYRVAVCVKYDGANSEESWTEYMNTNKVSRPFTFTKAGLYVITVVARDVTPNDPKSVTSTHVFKVRVY